MKTIVLSLALLLTLPIFSQNGDSKFIVTGKVVNVQGNPVNHAIVSEKGTFNEVETNAQGTFQIELTSGNELMVTAFLMDPKIVTVSNNDPIEIVMTADSELLETVLLKRQKLNDSTITMLAGERKKDAIGYGYDKDQESFISIADTDMFSVLRKIPGTFVNGIQGQSIQPQVYLQRSRTFNGGPAQIVVDGIPTSHNILSALDPNNVVKINILRGLAATNLYGAQAVNGVILITTRASVQVKDEVDPNKMNLSKRYSEIVPKLSEIEKDQSKPYLKILSNAQTADAALAMYEDLKLQPENRNVPFYVSVANDFSKYGDLYAHKVLSDLFFQTQNNPRVLKTIVFTLEQKGMMKQSKYVLEHFIEKYPDQIQLYRDLAKVYTELGLYNLATALYKQMIYNKIPNVDFTPIEDIVINEFRSLISHHRNKIDTSNIPNDFLIANFKKEVRIVLEYTNSQAEFEVQFVSPKKRYYTWNHTSFDNSEIIQSEIQHGYGIKEFVIEDSNYGDWIVNIRQTKESLSANPTYLKYTIYKNYGSPKETKVTKVVNLSEHSEKVTLDNFKYLPSS